MSAELQQKINLEHSSIFVDSDEIIQVHATNRTYGVKELKEIHEAFQTLGGDKKILILLIASDFTLIDKDARMLLSSKEAEVNSIAKAYVIKSLAQRILLNFLIQVNGTPVPVKFFTEKNKAVKWLKSFRN